MGLLDKIFDACRGSVDEQPTAEQVSTVHVEEPQPELWDFQVLVKLLLGSNSRHEEVVVVRHQNQEAARLDAYWRVADRFGRQVVYGEADVLSKTLVTQEDSE